MWGFGKGRKNKAETVQLGGGAGGADKGPAAPVAGGQEDGERERYEKILAVMLEKMDVPAQTRRVADKIDREKILLQHEINGQAFTLGWYEGRVTCDVKKLDRAQVKNLEAVARGDYDKTPSRDNYISFTMLKKNCASMVAAIQGHQADWDTISSYRAETKAEPRIRFEITLDHKLGKEAHAEIRDQIAAIVGDGVSLHYSFSGDASQKHPYTRQVPAGQDIPEFASKPWQTKLELELSLGQLKAMGALKGRHDAARLNEDVDAMIAMKPFISAQVVQGSTPQWTWERKDVRQDRELGQKKFIEEEQAAAVSLSGLERQKLLLAALKAAKDVSFLTEREDWQDQPDLVNDERINDAMDALEKTHWEIARGRGRSSSRFGELPPGPPPGRR